MRQTLLSLCLACFFSAAQAGILPDAQREELLSLVLQNFWGKAKLANGEFAQPASAAERTTVPVARAVANRAFDVGEVSGLAEWCGLDWQTNYAALTRSARARGFSDKQVAFVSFLHGAAQGRIAAAMARSGSCKEQEKAKVEQLVNQSRARGLDGVS